MSSSETFLAADDRLLDLLRQVKALAAEYYTLTGKPLGVTGEVAEFEAAKLLGLTLAAARTPAFDAHRGTERIQIKGRVFRGTYAGQRMGHVRNIAGCDSVVLVLLDDVTMSAREIWEVPAGVVAPLQARQGTRGIPVRHFVAVGCRVWPQPSP